MQRHAGSHSRLGHDHLRVVSEGHLVCEPSEGQEGPRDQEEPDIQAAAGVLHGHDTSHGDARGQYSVSIW